MQPRRSTHRTSSGARPQVPSREGTSVGGSLRQERLLFTTDNAGESITGGSISVVRAVSVVATAQGDASADGGGGGDSGYIAPKDEYDADDLGKRVWENGIDKVIELVTQAGHSRVVAFQELANAASALDADGNNVTTGIAGEFLGIFANLSAVPALSVVDGSWAGFVGSGDFEIQDPTAFYSSEHWNSYNPFRGSGTRPWSTITLADGTTTLDHEPFRDPDTDVVSDWRIVNSTGHAERFTTAVGEAFFVQNERKILMVIEFTAHADDEVRYRAVPYVASNALRAHPMARWWGESQDSAHDDPATVTFLGDRYYRLTGKQAAPDEHWAGGSVMGVSLATGALAPNYDLITRDGAAEARGDFRVLDLPAGRFRVKVRLWSSADANVELGLFAYEVETGADDQLLFALPGYITAVNVPLSTGETDNVRIAEFNEILSFTDATQLTFIYVGLVGTNNGPLVAADKLVSFYIEVERLD